MGRVGIEGRGGSTALRVPLEGGAVKCILFTYYSVLVKAMVCDEGSS